MIIDMMLIVFNPPRGVAAFQAFKNEDRKAYYAKTRMMTFWIYSIVMLVATIGYIFYEVLNGENPYFVIVLGILAGVCVWILLDFHYCRCINFWAKDALQAEKREREALDAELKGNMMDDENPQPRRKSSKSKRGSRKGDSMSDNTDLTNEKPRRKSKGKKKKRKSKQQDDFDPSNSNLEEYR
jgi:hypothetical protein